MRLDAFLVQKKYVSSRERAKERIEHGDVAVNGVVAIKPSFDVSEDDDIFLGGEGLKWVSRAGLKLEAVFEQWTINVSGKVCVDIGASTGGFTEVLLAKGATKVYAIDVGHSQLHSRLRNDSRVVNMEEMHIKDVSREDVGEIVDCVVIDVSFISLEKVLPKAYELLEKGGELIALIKPQFEVGKDNTKKGIVTDEKKRDEVVVRIGAFARNVGFDIQGTIQSPIEGGDGNTEFLMYAIKV